MAQAKKKMLSVVVSVYNEEQVLPCFYPAAVAALEDCGWDYELIFVNDGSSDESASILDGFACRNPRVKVVHFARNFGHEAAMIAGIDHASGDGVVCMDADLQHPPECLGQIVEKFEEGWEIISMVRQENPDAGFFSRMASCAFYRLLNAISPVKFENNASDFFALSRQAADVLRSDYRERVRYLRGYVQSMGFRKTALSFRANQRAAGQSKYSLKKLLKFSFNAICSFSDLPLRLGMYSGLIVGVLGLILMVYSIVIKLVFGAPGGYTTLVVAMCFLFSILFFLLGIIGQYIAVLFAEVKQRPIYIVRDVKGGEERPGEN